MGIKTFLLREKVGKQEIFPRKFSFLRNYLLNLLVEKIKNPLVKIRSSCKDFVVYP